MIGEHGQADEADEAAQVLLRGLIRREAAGERHPVLLGVPHSVPVLGWVVRWASRRGPMIEWSPEVFAAINGELRRVLGDDPTGAAVRQAARPVTLHIGPYTAVLLLGAIDWYLTIPHHHGAATFLDPVTSALTPLLDEEVAAMIRRMRPRR